MKKNNYKKLFGKDTSIVLNTFNRKNLLIRTCKILEELNFGGQLIICDASEGDLQKKIEQEIGQLICSYSLNYINIPKNGCTFYTSMLKCFNEGLKIVDKSFTILTFDDDIPLPKTLSKFEKFLIENKSFNACMGQLVWYNYKDNKNFSKINSLGAILKMKNFLFGERIGVSPDGNDLIGDKLIIRLNEFTKKPVHLIFAFQRSKDILDIISKNFSEFDTRDHGHFILEYYNWFSTIVRGNLKYFHKPSILRTCHNSNISHPDRNHIGHLPIIEKLAKDSWQKNVSLFRANLYSIIKKYDQTLTEKEIIECIDGYVKFYIKHRLNILKKDRLLVKIINTIKDLFYTSVIFKFEVFFHKFSFYYKLSLAIFKSEKKN